MLKHYTLFHNILIAVHEIMHSTMALHGVHETAEHGRVFNALAKNIGKASGGLLTVGEEVFSVDSPYFLDMEKYLPRYIYVCEKCLIHCTCFEMKPPTMVNLILVNVHVEK